jgi:hypothetical protein
MINRRESIMKNRRPPPPKRRAESAAIPTPSAKFHAAQRELSKLIQRKPALGSKAWRATCDRQQQVERYLRAEFTRAFGFTKDVFRRAERFFSRLPNAGYFQDFDHVDFYQRGGSLIIVSQPYGINKRRLRQWCEEHGAASHTIIDEWAYYYPDRARCFYVEFTSLMPTKKSPRSRPQESRNDKPGTEDAS